METRFRIDIDHTCIKVGPMNPLWPNGQNLSRNHCLTSSGRMTYMYVMQVSYWGRKCTIASWNKNLEFDSKYIQWQKWFKKGRQPTIEGSIIQNSQSNTMTHLYVIRPREVWRIFTSCRPWQTLFWNRMKESVLQNIRNSIEILASDKKDYLLYLYYV